MKIFGLFRDIRCIRHVWTPALLVGILLAMANAGDIYEYVQARARCGAQPIRLRNKDGRCLANSLLQVFDAAMRARGFFPELMGDDAVAESLKAYERNVTLPEERLGFDIDLLRDLSVLMPLYADIDRYVGYGCAQGVAAWTQRAIPHGDQKICSITIRTPSEISSLEQAQILERHIAEHCVHQGTTPELVVAAYDYEGDSMENWEKPLPLRSRDYELRRPPIQTLINAPDAFYRILGAVHLVQDAIPTSLAGHTIMRSGSRETWKKLGITNESHATACVRWGDAWFEMNDELRYDISVESADGSVMHDGVLCDAVVMRSHPGVPVMCMYERIDDAVPLDDIQPIDSYHCVWTSAPGMMEGIEQPDHYKFLHTNDTNPLMARRVFTVSSQFLPA